jgi:alpha-tubulin suppressor-like RCC1 family protein
MILGRRFYRGGDPDVFFYGAGQNTFGECGLAGNGSSYSGPAGPGDQTLPEFVLPVAAPWNQRAKWRQFALYSKHTAAIRADGTLWVAGDGGYGQQGQGDTTGSRVLRQIGSATNWRKVGVGLEFTAALDANGDIWTVGRNDIAAQLNDGTTSGVALPDGSGRVALYNTALTAPPFRPIDPIRFVDMWCGWRLVLALDNQGRLWSWGNNGSRQLGRGSPEGTDAGWTADRYCLQIDPPGPWLKASTGDYGGAGFHADGNVWMWGLFGNGQRGPGVSSNHPAIVACNDPGQRWVDVICGERSTFFIRQDGTLWACGRSGSGELGTGSTAAVNATLAQVIGVDGATTITQWREVSCALNHTIAVAIDGTLWAWGSNANKKMGALGLSGSSYAVPQRVSTLTGWRNPQAGETASVVLKLA